MARNLLSSCGVVIAVLFFLVPSFAEELPSTELFNQSGCADLAVGAPGETVGGDFEAGRLYVYRGWSWGLGPAAIWDQDSATVTCCAAEAGDRFGFALAAGDFNRDGFDDLVIGVPGEEYDEPPDSEHEGAINVLYGSASGLITAGTQFWAQVHPWVTGTAEDDDRFGKALAATRGRWSSMTASSSATPVAGNRVDKKSTAVALALVVPAACGSA